MSRLNWPDIAPENATALFGVHCYYQGIGSPRARVHLAFLRVSQIRAVLTASTFKPATFSKPWRSTRSVPVWAEVAYLFFTQ